MVCYMYYTDVFVGTGNINNLKDALEAELEGSYFNSIDLTQLVHGLCLFMGYPSCVCSLKANVDKSLQDISEKLIQDFEAVQSCVNLKTLNLNCNSCNSKEILCKCCVIRCIKELRGQSKQSKCNCVKNASTDCKCKDPKEKCCKDFLSGLEACLSLLNLKTDLQDCKCVGQKCCKNGKCINSSCTLCSPQNFPDNAMTGLGICPMNPRKLAEKLDGYFKPKTGGSKDCTCQCGSGQGVSCCCLACQSCSSPKSCFCLPNSKCSCASKLQLPKDCPCKTFCKTIQNVKVLADSTDMRCCEGGQKCHCQLPGSGSNCKSGCCVVEDTSGAGSDHYQHSVKCVIRRVVKFFASFDPSSKNCSKLCCEIFCVLKCCEFLRDFYDKGGKKSCKECNGGTKGKCKGSTLKTPASSKECCNGTITKCVKDPNCCLGCQDCSAIKFSRALQKLQYSGPCGLDLYRLLKDLLNFCSNVMAPNQDFIHDTVLAAVNSCPDCKKSGTDSSKWKACECSKNSGSCLACTTLRGNSKLMSILRHGYSSAYSEASLNSLCSSSKPCSGCKSSSSCPCKSSGFPPLSSTSCNGSCCENCDVRKAAKIFLGMLPCLYYGLKILYDRSKYGSGFAGWHDISVDSNGLPKNDLAKFLYAWGYDLRPLKTKKGSEFFSLLEKLFGSDSSGPLQKLSTLVTEKYFTSFPSRSLSSVSTSKSPPTTVRQMLLWLYGLRFQKHFSDIVEICKSLCSPFGNSFNSDAFCYYIYTCCFLLPVAIISLIEDSSSAQTAFSSSSDWTSFSYPEDLSSLFEKLCEYARKIFVALAFLYYQCERNAGQGGWNDCAFGRQCALKFQQNSPASSLAAPSTSSSTSSSDCSCPNSKTYLCTAINKDKVHEHCNGSASTQNSCLGFDSTVSTCDPSSAHPNAKPQGKPCKPCPHPLVRFLTANSPSKDYPFGLSDIVPMGFKTEHLPSTPVKGEKLYFAIYGFCKDGFYPLTRLVQFILCVSQRPPESLFDLYAFFKKFVEALNSKPELSSTFVNWINGEPGFYSGSALKTALQNLNGARNSHSGSHTPANLFSLFGCDGQKLSSGTSHPTCGKYLHALTEEVSGVFTPELCSMYLSWICHLTKDFYSEFKAFYDKAQGKFSSCSHCKSCKKIVECPCALPFLYSQGFTFLSPSGLNCVNAQGQEHKNNDGTQKHSGGEGDPGCTRKTCSQFLTQLGLVVNGDLFTKLLEEIEKFLWSIRKPFFLFILAFWALVISYFLYVQLYHLDVLELNSHDHPAWSFKILPSTLFSDASSKLKDLSYFTL